MVRETIFSRECPNTDLRAVEICPIVIADDLLIILRTDLTANGLPVQTLAPWE